MFSCLFFTVVVFLLFGFAGAWRLFRFLSPKYFPRSSLIGFCVIVVIFTGKIVFAANVFFFFRQTNTVHSLSVKTSKLRKFCRFNLFFCFYIYLLFRVCMPFVRSQWTLKAPPVANCCTGETYSVSHSLSVPPQLYNTLTSCKRG